MEPLGKYMPTDKVNTEQGLPQLSVANAMIISEIMTSRDAGKGESTYLLIDELGKDPALLELVGSLAEHYLGHGRNTRQVLLGAAIAKRIYERLSAFRETQSLERPACSSLSDLEIMLKSDLGEERFNKVYAEFIKGFREHYAEVSSGYRVSEAILQLLIAEKDKGESQTEPARPREASYAGVNYEKRGGPTQPASYALGEDLE